jgi:hypothetical protein
MDFGTRNREWRAWMSYLGIQAAWLLLVFLTPLGVSVHPSKLWAIPFGCITIAGGLHLTYFRFEYSALVQKVVGLLPLARHLFSVRHNPGYYLPLGVGYTLFGVASVAAVFLA